MSRPVIFSSRRAREARLFFSSPGNRGQSARAGHSNTAGEGYPLKQLPSVIFTIRGSFVAGQRSEHACTNLVDEAWKRRLVILTA